MRLTITLVAVYLISFTKNETINMEVLELLGLSERPKELLYQIPSLRNSASRFLRQVYREIQADDRKPRRRKRTTSEEDNFITELDRKEIETCNNLITFSSKPKPIRKLKRNNTATDADEHLHLYFNTNNVPQDLKLFHATLRVFYDPAHSISGLDCFKNITISIYERISFKLGKEKEINNFRILTSLNLTSTYKGWLEFNVTNLFVKWVKYRKYRPINFMNELILDAAIENNTSAMKFGPHDLGLIVPALKENTEYNPFIIGYFNGPQLMEKMQKLRFKREMNRRKHKARPSFMNPALHALHLQYTYKMPKTCERLNFTVNFKDTHMDSWVIAPKKFEAYFCGGECNFPLGAQLNATNHAIVQTLMQLKQPHLPKPCCAPTVLESITILHFLNEDNVNLVKFPQSVAKECGCL